MTPRYEAHLTLSENEELRRLTRNLTRAREELRTLTYCRNLIIRRATARMTYATAQSRVRLVRLNGAPSHVS